jgi:hypothetical protein
MESLSTWSSPTSDTSATMSDETVRAAWLALGLSSVDSRRTVSCI